MKIVHLVRDDKFIDIAYETFEDVFPGSNKYILLSFNQKKQYLKKTPVEIINPFKFILNNLFLKEDHVTVIHWMDYKKIAWLMFLRNPKKILWIGWGADYYNLFRESDSLLLPLTKAAFEKNKVSSFKVKMKYSLVSSAKSFFLFLFKKFCMKKISHFSPVLREDYAFVKAKLPKVCPPYLDWNYGNLEDHWIAGLGSSSDKGNILLGNSATAENNHMDAFKVLQGFDLGQKKVICPLSYGDMQFKQAIKQAGEESLKENFVCLDTFLPLSEYNSIISSCSFVVMNHLRQQGLGNIFSMLYNGSRVYLQEKNPIYSSLKKRGIHINSMLDPSQGSFDPLSDQEIQDNRRILKEYIGKAVMKEKTKNLIGVLVNETLPKS